LRRDESAAEASDRRAFRVALREHGVYHCTDGATTGLSLTNAEAARLRADPRSARLHPRTFLLDARRRVVVVLDWHIPHEVCPYYADHKCTVYDARPLVCRAYPVLVVGLGRGGPLGLAPECPEMPAPPATLRAETRARRAIDRAHEALDATTARVLEAGRFAMRLPAREAAARARRYRAVTPEEWLHEHARPA
jgi:Fe-S-cluster containining protein